MKLSQRLRDERDYAISTIGVGVICTRCRATLATFADACTAGLSDPCPGYMAIENAKTRFNLARDAKPPKFDEYEELVGGESEEHTGDLCRRCNDWPCVCGKDEQ